MYLDDDSGSHLCFNASVGMAYGMRENQTLSMKAGNETGVYGSSLDPSQLPI